MDLDTDVIKVALNLSDLRILLYRIQNECDEHSKNLATVALDLVDKTCNLLDPINERLTTIKNS